MIHQLKVYWNEMICMQGHALAEAASHQFFLNPTRWIGALNISINKDSRIVKGRGGFVPLATDRLEILCWKDEVRKRA